jgi:hypothetical protein
LAFLVDYPGPEVREWLADALEAYRGKAARDLRAILLANDNMTLD